MITKRVHDECFWQRGTRARREWIQDNPRKFVAPIPIVTFDELM